MRYFARSKFSRSLVHKNNFGFYGSHLSHIFEKPSISIEKPSIFIEKLCISIKNPSISIEKTRFSC